MNFQHLLAFHEQSLTSLTQKYIMALKENINSHFEHSLPAFWIFHPTALPGRSDPAFKDDGADDIEILADYFYNGHHSKAEMKVELLCEWQKFKYNLLQMKNQIPSDTPGNTRTTRTTGTTRTTQTTGTTKTTQTTEQHELQVLQELQKLQVL